MADLFENPMGTDGFEFVEFAAPDRAVLDALFTSFGFTAVAKHRRRDVTLYRQGEINFLVNAEPGSFAADFAQQARALRLRLRDARKRRALRAVARSRTRRESPLPISPIRCRCNTPMIEGIGGSILYLVDQYGEQSHLRRGLRVFRRRAISTRAAWV